VADEGSAVASEPRKRDVSAILWVVVPLVVVGLLAFGFLSSDRGRPQPGEPAPAFSLPLLDGSQVALRDYSGQVLVVNFWASWCDVCKSEASDLRQVSEQYQDRGVAFLGVTFRDAREASQSFVDTYGLGYANGVDEHGRISRAYGVVAVPETFVIDPEGHVAAVYIGEVKAETLTQDLEELIAQ
jgi:cytochrome c biogenesis protein CcmG/thiol:disulfide interchange protein DsbE